MRTRSMLLVTLVISGIATLASYTNQTSPVISPASYGFESAELSSGVIPRHQFFSEQSITTGSNNVEYGYQAMTKMYDTCIGYQGCRPVITSEDRE
jgi:hypothetical protein